MTYLDTTTTNPHNGACPACHVVYCLRCADLEEKMSPDGYDGCGDCNRILKRYQRAYRKHRQQDHGVQP